MKNVRIIRNITVEQIIKLIFVVVLLVIGANVWVAGGEALLTKHVVWAEPVLMLFMFANIGTIYFGLRFIQYIFKQFKERKE